MVDPISVTLYNKDITRHERRVYGCPVTPGELNLGFGALPVKFAPRQVSL